MPNVPEPPATSQSRRGLPTGLRAGFRRHVAQKSRILRAAGMRTKRKCFQTVDGRKMPVVMAGARPGRPDRDARHCPRRGRVPSRRRSVPDRRGVRSSARLVRAIPLAACGGTICISRQADRAARSTSERRAISCGAFMRSGIPSDTGSTCSCTSRSLLRCAQRHSTRKEHRALAARVEAATRLRTKSESAGSLYRPEIAGEDVPAPSGWPGQARP
jgi:hypothetical protein